MKGTPASNGRLAPAATAARRLATKDPHNASSTVSMQGGNREHPTSNSQ
jgi:hypothetical protein